MQTCEACKNNSGHSVRQHKHWFNDECLEKYNLYIHAQKQFNKHKSYTSRINLANTKYVDKLFEAKLKSQYRRQELQTLKRINPKRFVELLRKRKRCKDTNLSANDFFRYFSDFRSNMHQNEAVDLNIGPCEELDQDIKT